MPDVVYTGHLWKAVWLASVILQQPYTYMQGMKKICSVHLLRISVSSDNWLNYLRCHDLVRLCLVWTFSTVSDLSFPADLSRPYNLFPSGLLSLKTELNFQQQWKSVLYCLWNELLLKFPERKKQNRGVVVNNLSVSCPLQHAMSNTIQFLPQHQLGLTRSSKCLFSEWPGGVTLFSLSTFINLSTEVCSLI